MGMLSKIAAYIYGEDPYERYLEEERAFEERLTPMADDALANRIRALAATLRGEAPRYTDPEGQKSWNTRNHEFYTALNIVKDRIGADGLAAHPALEKTVRAAASVDPADQYATRRMATAIVNHTTENEWSRALKP
jgi:hypothetical protein